MKQNRNTLMMSEWTRIIIVNSILILILYTTSIGLVFYQRWYLKQYPYPLFLAASNQLIVYFFSAIFRISYNFITGKERITLSWKHNFQMMAVLGIVTAFHMGLSNLGLELNTVSLFTVSKSTNIIFILTLVLLLGLEKFSWKMIFIVAMIASGMALFTYKSPQLNVVGLLVTLAAAFMSALRWTLAQYVFHKSDIGIENPIDMMYYVDLWVFFFVLPMTVVFENWIDNLRYIIRFAFTTFQLGSFQWSFVLLSFSFEYDLEGQLFFSGPILLHMTPFVSATNEYRSVYEIDGDRITMLTVMSAMLAFCMEISKYLVIQRTSSITVSVLGIMQEIGTILIAHLTLNDQMTTINFFGLVFCMCGAACHAIYKYKRAKKLYYQEVEGINSASSIESLTDSDEEIMCKKKYPFRILSHH